MVQEFGETVYDPAWMLCSFCCNSHVSSILTDSRPKTNSDSSDSNATAAHQHILASGIVWRSTGAKDLWAANTALRHPLQRLAAVAVGTLASPTASLTSSKLAATG